MEFEKDTRASAQEIALADAPHVNVEPAHGDVRPDTTNIPNAARPDNRNFEFETESTADLAESSGTKSRHSHHRLALVLAIGTVMLFGAALAFLYLFR